MSVTLKIAAQEPRRDLTATNVHIAEYDRVTLRLLQQWPVDAYNGKPLAVRALGIVKGLLETMFPDAAHVGTRPLTESDLVSIRQDVSEQLAAPLLPVG